MNPNTLRGKECKVGQAGGWGIFAVLLPELSGTHFRGISHLAGRQGKSAFQSDPGSLPKGCLLKNQNREVEGGAQRWIPSMATMGPSGSLGLGSGYSS